MNILRIEKIKEIDRRKKQLILFFGDSILLVISIYLAYSMRFGHFWPYQHFLQDWWVSFALIIISIPLLKIYGIYFVVLRYLETRTVYQTVKSITLSCLVVSFIILVSRNETFPRSIIINYWFVANVLLLGTRFFVKWFMYKRQQNKMSKKPALIFGAGDAGVQLAQLLFNGNAYLPVGFIDDNRSKSSTYVQGLKVRMSDELPNLINIKKVQRIFLAIPSATRERIREILKLIEGTPVEVKTLPPLERIVNGQIHLSDIKDLDVNDIMGREPIKPLKFLLKRNIENKTVLVSGAGGSIGSELCRQIINLHPKSLIMLEWNEFALYEISREILENSNGVPVEMILASTLDEEVLKVLFDQYKIDTVYHAAAYKHVPLVEKNPIVGVKNNIFGTFTIGKICGETNVTNFVLISTDKAVRPTNIMGATKRFSELILHGLNQEYKTRFSMVRFGNVIDSAGSVVPLFREQIRKGGPLTITHEEVTRFFMSIPEAVELVIQAGAMAKGGEVFILDMGQPIKILDLAKKMIFLMGHSPQDENHPNGNIAIKITGLRPGEKLYEELLIGENEEGTEHPHIFMALENNADWGTVKNGLDELSTAVRNYKKNDIFKILKKYVEEYTPSTFN